MIRINNSTVVRPKSERLGWENYSSSKPVQIKSIAGKGKKVAKNAYCNSSVNYRKLVP